MRRGFGSFRSIVRCLDKDIESKKPKSHTKLRPFVTQDKRAGHPQTGWIG
jgi:hypothetical protein